MASDAVQWRPVGLADVPALTRLFADIEELDQYGWRFDEGFLTRWLAGPGIDHDRGTTAAFAAGRMVAAGVLAARDEADPVHATHYEGGVHPAYRGRGLGTRLLDWAVRAAVPLHENRFAGQPLRIQCGFPVSDDAAAALFARHGFAPVRYFRAMTRRVDRGDLPPVRVPGGFEIVGYRPDLDEAMRVAKNEAFRGHWDVTPTPPAAWRSRFTGPDFLPGLSPLALDTATGQVAGLIVTLQRGTDPGRPGEPDAHVNNVGTLPPAAGGAWPRRSWRRPCERPVRTGSPRSPSRLTRRTRPARSASTRDPGSPSPVPGSPTPAPSRTSPDAGLPAAEHGGVGRCRGGVDSGPVPEVWLPRGARRVAVPGGVVGGRRRRPGADCPAR